MNNQEYEHKKRECWEEYVDMLNRNCATRYMFDKIFDRAYALGKQEKDAEGEGLLYVSRKEVQKMYAHYDKISNDPNRPKDYIESVYEYADGVTMALDELFGSKCLPDLSEVKRTLSENLSEPKLAEPKFKRCEKVITPSGEVCIIEDTHFENNCWLYLVGDPDQWVSESDLEPYTEQKEVMRMKPIESKISVCLATKEEDEEFRQFLHENGFKWNNETSLISLSCWSSLIEDDKIHYVHPDKTVTYCGKKTSDTLTFSEFKKQYFGEESLSQETPNCDKQFDNILKDSFRNERRLNIAAMAMQGILSNPTAMNGPKLIDGDEEILAKWSLKFADALIAKCEKGGSDGN